MTLRLFCLLTAASCVSAIALASPQQSDLMEPESATGTQQQISDEASPQTHIVNTVKKLAATKQMVVSANPYASEAGAKVLRNGGNAADAMVTVQAILGLVEPQSSGLGGGAFTLYYNANKKALSAFDGRETAPLNAESDLFLDENQSPIGFFDAVVGGRSVGTPGTVALLGHIHGKFGSKPWRELLQPAITLAEQGFIVSPRLANAIDKDKQRLSIDPDARDYFMPSGEPLEAGAIRKNPQYAQVLRMLADKGAEAFYQKEFAIQIAEKVQSARNPGFLSPEDFVAYKVIARKPVCAPFNSYSVCGMGPPSSGAVSVGQILMTAEAAGLASYPPESPTAWQIIADATRLAFADRNVYLADPAYFDAPDWLLNPQYIKQRAALIQANKPLSDTTPGQFETRTHAHLVAGQQTEQASTTHFSISDAYGNVLSSTSTIENGFGSRLMVNGFLLNNELTDFSFAYKNAEGLIANRVEPGKRPRSSMAPTIVLKSGTPVMAIGSPGGSRIINYVANSLIRTLLWKQDTFEAINAPHISNRYGQMDVEIDRLGAEELRAFEVMGYKVESRDLNSGLHAIVINQKNGELNGSADLRREGHVAGD